MDTVQTRTYDDQNRLLRVETTDGRDGSAGICSEPIKKNEYDAEGRVSVSRTWCNTTEAGAPSMMESYAYGADGTVTVDSLDFLNDTPNHTIVLADGTEKRVTHQVQTRSPECASIYAAIGESRELRCRVP